MTWGSNPIPGEKPDPEYKIEIVWLPSGTIRKREYEDGKVIRETYYSRWWGIGALMGLGLLLGISLTAFFLDKF